MKNSSHKSSINIPHWALGLLLLFFFCAPAYASDAPATPTFRSTSPFGINQTIKEPATVNINGIHQGTIYKPFSSDHPFAELDPSSGSGGGSSNGNNDDDIGIPGWADTPSEPLPIGDGMGILLLMATMMVGAIFLKQRKQLSESISKSTTSTTNINNLRGNQLPTALKKENNTTQHMTTRKQTYQSFFQKLFLLLVFVCFVGQVSADKTIYFRPSTTAFRYGYTDPDNMGTTWPSVYWTKGISNYFPIELRTTNTSSYSSQWTDWSELTWADDILSGDKTRFIPITVPNNYKYIVVYRCVNQEKKTVNKTNYDSWKNSTNKGKEDTNIKNQNTIPKIVSNGQPSKPEPIPTDGKNLLCNREGWWDVWYWAYYLPEDNDVKVYFANLYEWPNIQMLLGKDIYSKASYTIEPITNTKLCYRSFYYTEFGYEQYGFISNPTNETKFSTSHQIHPYQYNCVGSNEGTTGNEKYMTGWVDSDSYSKNDENTTAKANRIANRIKTANKYTALQANLLSGSELFIPESGENGTAASKSHLTNGWKDLNHTLTIKNYIYNPQTKSYDNSNTGGYVTYYTHKLTGATTTQRIPEGDGTITVDANSGSTTAAYTAKTVLQAYPKEGYKFHGWYDKDGTVLHDKAEFTWYKVQNYDNEVHARFLPKNVKQFKYRVQTCASGQEFNTTSFDATGGSINVTATDGQSVTISKANGNDNEYQKLYHQDDTQITCTATPNSGYVFVGWWNNDNGQIVSNPWKEKAGNMDDYVTARFASVDNVTTQTINVSGSGSATITRYLDQASTHTITTSKSVTLNTWKGKDVTLVATPKDGYTFVGWYERQNLVSKELEYEYTATEARNITAYFAEGTGTTTLKVRAMKYDGQNLINSLDGGTFTMTHSGGIVYKPINKEDKDVPVLNTPVTFAAEANDGYEFIAWFNNKKGQFLDNPWIMQNPGNSNTYDKTVTAVFASNEDYAKKQDIKIEGPGTVTANYTFYKDDYKQALTKTTTFHHNSSFVAWSGHNVTLTAEALAGYEFVGWYDAEDKPINDGVTGNTLTYKATSAHTITAKFKSKVNKLTVSVLNYNPEYDKFEEYGYEYNTVTLTQGSTTVSSYSSLSQTFDSECTVTLTATPEVGEDGYDFVGWYINDEKLTKAGSDKSDLYTLTSDASTELTLNLSGEVAVQARFAPKKCWKVTLDANAWGKYTLHYSKDRNFSTFQSIESSYTQPIYTYVPYEAFVTVSSVQPIHGYKCLRYKRGGSTAEIGTPIQCSTNNHNIQVEIVREEEQVVYLNLRGAEDVLYWSPTNDPNKYAYYAYVDNEFYSSDIKRKWIKMEHVNDYCYKCTISPANRYNKVNFVQIYIDANGNPTTKEGNAVNMSLLDGNETYSLVDIRDTYKVQKIRSGATPIPATRHNCYRLNWFWNSSTQKNENAWTTPPTTTGDYRLIYIEQEVASKTEINRTYEFIDGDRVKKIASGTKLDTVSLHIYNKVSKDKNGDLTGTALNNPEIILQQWDGTAWVDIERHMVFGPLQTDNTGNIRMPGRKNTAPNVVIDRGIDAIKAQKENATKDYGCGVWNFVIEQDGSSARLVINQTHRYEGTYYIRTPNADGQYNNFTHPGNILSYSEYAKNNSDYSHYFIRYVDIYEDGTPTAEAGKHPVVKFCVANDYAINLSKEFTNVQNRFEPEEDIYVLNAGDLPADASVRFGWDIRTNRLTRAYIANTTIKNNEYLVVEGDNIGTLTGDATYFTDNSNWLYSIDLPDATAGAAAKVKAKMNGQYQYFMGSGAQDGYETLISGNGANTYPIRLLYDFKDDRFTTIYHPESGTINNDVELSTPLMIEREHNGKATQIVLNTNKITTVEAGQDQFTQPAYAVMTFLEEVLADASKTHHEKMFYWISFPFDVCIRDVFGLGDYGKYWIMEEYNGAQRAASGLAKSNWKYITKKSAVLSKNVGYVLCLNYSQILQDKLFKSYGSSDQELNSGKLSLYFPSNGTLSPRDITGNQRIDVNLEEHYNANTAWNHHNWHIIGVPSFADPEFKKIQQDAPFVYQYWHPGDAYSAESINEVDFQSMHAYMVQYTGDITWTSVVNNGGSVSGGKSLAAKKDADTDEKIMLRLELQQAGSTLDKTYVQLRNDKGTKGFDMSLDLTKIINAGANIYSIVDNHEMAGNAIPKDETVLPLGVVITAAGAYTFAMPQGTEGMIVELIDYEQGTSTNLLMSDCTVTLDKGTFNQRFALRLVPDKVATSVDHIGTEADGDKVRKLLIDGVLYLQQGNNTYDAQGKHVQ